MSIHPRNHTTNRYPIYTELFGNDDCTVFDFGGNHGGLLHFSQGAIKESSYTCLDVSADAVDMGAVEYPEASWNHYDRFNWAYNHTGNTDIIFPDIDKNQDHIWAYSVFSHTDYNEFLTTIQWLMTFNYKKIALSFLDINGYNVKQYFMDKRLKTYGLTVDLHAVDVDDMFYFIDHNYIEASQVNSPQHGCELFLAFYNIRWLLAQLATHDISATVQWTMESDIPFLIIKAEDNVN
jgi:hypothetical protein